MKINFLTGVLALLLVLLGFKIVHNTQENNQLRVKTEVLAAIQDTLIVSRDKYDRVVAEKRVIEGDYATIKAQFEQMTPNQQRLVTEIDDLPKKTRKKAISGTQVEQMAVVHVVDSVLVPSKADYAWSHVSDTLNYSIQVQDSVLTIEKLEIPNDLSVITYRDASKRLHVQVTNSNPIYKTQDVDTIVLEKDKKSSIWVKILYFIGGGLAGAALHR